VPTGEASRQGWTTEAHLIAGDVRTDDDNLRDIIRKPEVILKYTNDKNQLIGCVICRSRRPVIPGYV
jgi:hypothetical protein